jgi:hypothetical protein
MMQGEGFTRHSLIKYVIHTYIFAKFKFKYQPCQVYHARFHESNVSQLLDFHDSGNQRRCPNSWTLR